jgi:hypothetical protein
MSCIFCMIKLCYILLVLYCAFVVPVYFTLDTDDLKARVMNSALIGGQQRHPRLRSIPCCLFINANSRWPLAWWVRVNYSSWLMYMCYFSAFFISNTLQYRFLFDEVGRTFSNRRQWVDIDTQVLKKVCYFVQYELTFFPYFAFKLFRDFACVSYGLLFPDILYTL